MNELLDMAADEVSDEISSLIETLHRTEQRLEQLTAGQIDSVSDASGRTFLLRRAQEQVRHDESARQATILNALPAHIALLDQQGQIISVNHAWRRFAPAHGFQNPDLGLNVNYLQICDNARGKDSWEGASISEGIRTVLDGESERYSMEYPCGARWFLLNVTPLLSEEHRTGAVVMHLDITERKRAEDDLRAMTTKTERRERLLTSLLSAITDQVYILDREGRFLFANQALLNLWGATMEEVFGKTFLELLEPSELAERVYRQVLGVFETEASLSDEATYTGPGGSIGTFEYKFEPVFGGDGKTIEYVAASSRDISERKRSEMALRESNEKFELLANNVTDVFWIRSPDMRTLHYLSPAFETIWGRSVESHIETPDGWKDYIFSDDRERVGKEFASLALDCRSREIEYRIVRPDGEIRWVLIRGFQVRDSLGTLTQIIGTAKDITERKKSESEFGEMESRLRQSQKMEAVGQLAAGVAHEFNNLLQALMSMATMARLKAFNPEVSKLSSEMETQIRHGAVLTQQLLAFSRQHELQKEEFDLREQVDKAIVLLRHLLPDNIGVVLESAPERLSMEGDDGQLQQIVLNLAINARDAMPDGGTLTLRNGKIGDEIFLDVEDSGVGMDEATRARIFEPFFTTKKVGKGTGLGLAVVYGIVEQHGGRIDLQSSLGEGSRFRMFFPAIAERSTPLVETSQESVAIAVATGSVLLVEDEPAVREGIAMLLELTGYQVTLAGSAEEALEMPMEPVDVLLSDVTLPGLGGFALAEQLCGRWPSLKVIMMSGYMPEGAGRPEWKLLQKPFELDHLAGVLAEVMKEAIAEERVSSGAGVGTVSR